MNTSNPRRTMGRRVNANVMMPFSTDRSRPLCPPGLGYARAVPIIEDIEAGASRREAAERYGLSPSVVVIWTQRWQVPGSRSVVWRFFERRNIGFKKKPVRGGAKARGKRSRAA